MQRTSHISKGLGMHPQRPQDEDDTLRKQTSGEGEKSLSRRGALPYSSAQNESDGSPEERSK